MDVDLEIAAARAVAIHGDDDLLHVARGHEHLGLKAPVRVVIARAEGVTWLGAPQVMVFMTR
jgi:hypothetical protein